MKEFHSDLIEVERKMQFYGREALAWLALAFHGVNTSDI